MLKTEQGLLVNVDSVSVSLPGASPHSTWAICTSGKPSVRFRFAVSTDSRNASIFSSCYFLLISKTLERHCAWLFCYWPLLPYQAGFAVSTPGHGLSFSGMGEGPMV